MAKNYNKNKKIASIRAAQRSDNENRVLNLAMRMSEPTATAPTKMKMADSALPTKADIGAFKDAISTSSDDPDGSYEVIQPNEPQILDAPTGNPTRPRALSIGYEKGSQTLTVVFRDNTWWEYRGVAADMWDGLKNSDSTGKYLKSSGLDSWHDMGPAEIKSMDRSYRVQLNQQATISARLQKLKGFMESLSKDLE